MSTRRVVPSMIKFRGQIPRVLTRWTTSNAPPAASSMLRTTTVLVVRSVAYTTLPFAVQMLGGGDKKLAYATAVLFIIFYLTYIVFSILRAEDLGGFSSFMAAPSPDCPV